MSVVTQVWNYAAKSCILFLHIVKSESPSDDICVSHICFVFQCRHLAITKCSPQTQYRSGHNHSVAWVCQFARLCVLRSKSCICLKCVDTSFLLLRKCCALKSHFLLVLCRQNKTVPSCVLGFPVDGHSWSAQNIFYLLTGQLTKNPPVWLIIAFKFWEVHAHILSNLQDRYLREFCLLIMPLGLSLLNIC